MDKVNLNLDLPRKIGLELKKVLERLGRESESASVVLGATKLDSELEKLLKTALHNNPNGEDSLFDPDQPLSSFSAKINLAYRLNLIDRGFMNALHMIRKTRNDFAHSIDTESLQEKIHKSRLTQATTELRKTFLWKVFEALFSNTESIELR